MREIFQRVKKTNQIRIVKMHCLAVWISFARPLFGAKLSSITFSAPETKDTNGVAHNYAPKQWISIFSIIEFIYSFGEHSWFCWPKKLPTIKKIIIRTTDIRTENRPNNSSQFYWIFSIYNNNKIIIRLWCDWWLMTPFSFRFNDPSNRSHFYESNLNDHWHQMAHLL